jgi:hypothetical protein
MIPCTHSKLDTPTYRLALLFTLKGLRCPQCSKCLKLGLKTQALAVGLVFILPAILGVMMHSPMAATISGIGAFIAIIGLSTRSGLAGALRADTPDNQPMEPGDPPGRR